MTDTTILDVGMTCEGCAGAVKRILGKVEGMEMILVEFRIIALPNKPCSDTSSFDRVVSFDNPSRTNILGKIIQEYQVLKPMLMRRRSL
mmetsp:Transcript_16069/g.24115  ORF Transcript_16069/g.24115 Transcript_16069/m.24115 type:complete len:89 (+) Transcript_16069:115-381(+)